MADDRAVGEQEERLGDEGEHLVGVLVADAFGDEQVFLDKDDLPGGSPWRGPDGGLTEAGAPLMRSLVALIFILFLLPGVTYGVIAGTVKTHRDVIAGMTWAMQSMGYYLVIMFFIAQFVAAFGNSNLGALVAVEGADLLRSLGLPMGITLAGIIVLAAAGVAAIGGDIRPLRFALGLGLILLGLAGGLVKGR